MSIFPKRKNSLTYCQENVWNWWKKYFSLFLLKFLMSYDLIKCLQWFMGEKNKPKRDHLIWFLFFAWRFFCGSYYFEHFILKLRWCDLNIAWANFQTSTTLLDWNLLLLFCFWNHIHFVSLSDTFSIIIRERKYA